MFSACQVEGKKRAPAKSPETFEEQLIFYRAQIVSIELGIDYHLKHQYDQAIKADFIRLEESLKSLSKLLEKEDQDRVTNIIETIYRTIENYNKTRSFGFFNRGFETISTQLRKLKKSIQLKLKQNNSDANNKADSSPKEQPLEKASKEDSHATQNAPNEPNKELKEQK